MEGYQKLIKYENWKYEKAKNFHSGSFYICFLLVPKNFMLSLYKRKILERPDEILFNQNVPHKFAFFSVLLMVK